MRPLGIVISVAFVVTAAVLAVVGGSGGGEKPVAVARPPHLVDFAGLRALEGELEHPLYWAGERPPARLELKEEAEGSAYLRYLPPGAAPGSRPAAFLTVGTYPVADAVAAVRRAARAAGDTVGHVPGGGVVLANPESTGSVYLAYPGSDLQIEVYDPAPDRAMALIRAGAITTVGAG